MAKTETEHWQSTPDGHDFPAAVSYLSLLVEKKKARAYGQRLRSASLVHQKAKDLLRASGLPLLPKDNYHVAKDLKKIKKGVLLSPVLLVRGDFRLGLPLIIADGYHRICASYYCNEDADIPCRMAQPIIP